jgi:two-component system response regulator PilR (NtrC family)
VRELENLLHRALALAAGRRIEREDLGLPDAVGRGAPEAGRMAPAPAVPRARGGAGGRRPLPSDLAAYLDQVERDILERALERHRYNRTAAGASLGCRCGRCATAWRGWASAPATRSTG